MSIEKKSLISNRVATKKAIVAKPGATKVQAPKTAAHTRTASHTRLGMGTRLTAHTRLAMPKVAINTRLKAL